MVRSWGLVMFAAQVGCHVLLPLQAPGDAPDVGAPDSALVTDAAQQEAGVPDAAQQEAGVPDAARVEDARGDMGVDSTRADIQVCVDGSCQTACLSHLDCRGDSHCTASGYCAVNAVCEKTRPDCVGHSPVCKEGRWEVQPGRERWILIPSGLRDVEGNSANTSPFGADGERAQVAYPAQYLKDVPSKAIVTGVRFRLNAFENPLRPAPR